MGCIYKIVNDVNDKVYVGKTSVGIPARWEQHQKACADRSGRHNTHLYYAMRKYGIEHFRIMLIEECDDAELNARERYWIAQHDSLRKGYNSTIGGDGYAVIDDQEKAKIVKLWNAGLTQKEISEKAHYNVKLVKRVLSENGVTRSEVVNRTVEIMRPKTSKPIYAYTVDGRFIKEFPSTRAAAKEYGIHYTTIGHVANGRDKSTHNMTFRPYKAEQIAPVKRQGVWEKIRVYQYSLDGEYLNEYESHASAAKVVGLPWPNSIRTSCKTERTTAGGYQWRYYKQPFISAADRVHMRSKVKQTDNTNANNKKGW